MSTSTATPRLRSTGRAPSVDLVSMRTMLDRWFSDDHPSVADLATEMGMCQATVRSALRLALGPLPRGKAALMDRGDANVQALVNAVPTEAVLGTGRMELLRRRREAGQGLDSLAKEFGISRRRVKAALSTLED